MQTASIDSSKSATYRKELDEPRARFETFAIGRTTPKAGMFFGMSEITIYARRHFSGPKSGFGRPPLPPTARLDACRAGLKKRSELRPHAQPERGLVSLKLLRTDSVLWSLRLGLSATMRTQEANREQCPRLDSGFWVVLRPLGRGPRFSVDKQGGCR
jgi:hypothetical protein